MNRDAVFPRLLQVRYAPGNMECRGEESGTYRDMPSVARSPYRRAISLFVLGAATAMLAACASPEPKSMVSKKPRSKEYFAESEYGVKASPRVSNLKTRLPRGGGRDQVGKPYKVRGKTYYPKEDKNYKKTGYASWYGDAFHGRLTANGEIYDKTHLTAAHPTMPLPSYARVTNLANGSSVIVRVNDRGPYSHNRLIDLSQKAAEMLDYTRVGTAKVKVEYVGRAPLHGQDDSYLMASYKPGKGMSDPSDGLPTGVMIAMAGPTPTRPAAKVAPVEAAPAAAFPGELADAAPDDTLRPALGDIPDAATTMVGTIDLPVDGPIFPERPVFDVPLDSPFQMAAAMSYADVRVNGAVSALDTLGSGAGLKADDIVASWKRQQGEVEAEGLADPYVLAGSFATRDEAARVAETLRGFGRVSIDASAATGDDLYSVTLRGDGRNGLDDMLEAAWSNGAPDAIAIRY